MQSARLPACFAVPCIIKKRERENFEFEQKKREFVLAMMGCRRGARGEGRGE